MKIINKSKWRYSLPGVMSAIGAREISTTTATMIALSAIKNKKKKKKKRRRRRREEEEKKEAKKKGWRLACFPSL